MLEKAATFVPGLNIAVECLKLGLQKINHDKCKKVDTHLEAFDLENEDHVKLLVEFFYSVFSDRNVQFCGIQKDLVDPLANAMEKLACDSVDRIFDHMEDEAGAKTLQRLRIYFKIDAKAEN